MTPWAERYLSEMSQRDLGTLGLVVVGVMMFLNVMVFIKPNKPAVKLPGDVWMWWAGIMLAGLVVRLAFVWVPAPWYDEAFTILVARLPLTEIIDATAGDVHPPLYYFNMWALGGNLLAMRLASVFWSMVGLFVFWCVMDAEWVNFPARLVALAIVALMPTEVYYGQEARMYSWLQLLVLLQVYFMLRREWIILGFVSILTLYSHNYGLYYCAIIYGLALWRAWHYRRLLHEPSFQQQAPGIITSGAAALAAFVPWLLILAQQMQRLEAGYWIQAMTPGSVLYDLLQIVYGVYMPDLAAIPAGISLGAILAAVLYYGITRRRYTELVMAFGVLLLAIITGLIYRPVLLFRALLPTLPFMAVIVAIAVTTEWRAWVWAVPAGATLLLSCAWLIWMNSTGESRAQNIMLAPGQSKSPRVIHLNDATLLGYMIYRPDQRHYLLKKEGCRMDGALSETTRAALEIKYIDESELQPGDEIAMIVGPLANACMVDEYHHLAARSTPVEMLDKTYWVEGVWVYEQ